VRLAPKPYRKTSRVLTGERLLPPLYIPPLDWSILICNCGIGPLHRIMQHRAGTLSKAGQIVTMINLIIAMQGTVREWVNYHSQHHRFADEAGDPHNPFESKLWAWVGWILFRDEKDCERPMALWLKNSPIIVTMDKYYLEISCLIHFALPAIIYLIVWASGGSLVVTALLHSAFIILRYGASDGRRGLS